ncbi:hypothetical protein CEXT_696061 [Caerostris extrusa]|uniref:Uncharacterized protein n=1 Tax=Caerostris extrusa TaxID=172846 RepID=A0AAV4S1Y7_CAEEX|nr:hypothetical protein CEXT_696061 [Caerostris extrusa]
MADVTPFVGSPLATKDMKTKRDARECEELCNRDILNLLAPSLHRSNPPSFPISVIQSLPSHPPRRQKKIAFFSFLASGNARVLFPRVRAPGFTFLSVARFFL